MVRSSRYRRNRPAIRKWLGMKKRKGGKRKRRTYKKKRRSRFSPAFLRHLATMKRLNGIRTFHEEAHGGAMVTNEGTTDYLFFCDVGTLTEFAAIIDNTLGQDGVALGLGASTDIQRKFFITPIETMLNVRNIMLHPVFVTMYTLVSKLNMDFGTGNTRSGAAADLNEGWEDDMAVGSTTTTLKTGDNVVSVSGAQVTSFAHHLRLRNSRLFSRQWRIQKAKLFKLNPGDDIHWKFRTKAFVFNPNVLGDGAHDFEVIKGITKVILIKLSGVMGESTATATNIARMQSKIGIECIKKARVVMLNNNDNAHAVTVNHDIFQTDYIGPGHHDEDADEP